MPFKTLGISVLKFSNQTINKWISKIKKKITLFLFESITFQQLFEGDYTA